MDEIKLTGLKVFAYHGVLPEEKKNGQDFFIDIVIKTDLRPAGASDDLTKTINYAEMAELASRTFSSGSFDLIEAAAENLSTTILKSYPLISEISVTVHKPSAPIGLPFSDVSVTVRRRWHTVFIAIGSNIGNPFEIFERARKKFFSRNDVRFVKESSLIHTKPYGVTEQPDFVNGMWKAETLLKPEELLSVLHEVEASEKRERLYHWGPRTLDLDIIYYDRLVMNTEELTIPHADMQNRDFVLVPLKELDPLIKHPVTNLTAGQMLEKIESENIM